MSKYLLQGDLLAKKSEINLGARRRHHRVRGDVGLTLREEDSTQGDAVVTTCSAETGSRLWPTAFCSANLILYWGGFSTTWKLAVAMLVGVVLFAIGAVRAGTMSQARLRNAIWIGPWLAGHVVIGAIGRYGGGSNALPEGVDLAVVVAFSLAIFYWAIALTLSKSEAAAAVAKDARQIDYEG